MKLKEKFNYSSSLISSRPRDSDKQTNEEEVISNFDFLQNEGEDENVNEEDDGDDGGNADDESDDREDEVKERRVGKKTKPGIDGTNFCMRKFLILFS